MLAVFLFLSPFGGGSVTSHCLGRDKEGPRTHEPTHTERDECTHWASESHKCLLLFGLSQAGTPARERLGQARSLTQAKVEHRDRDTVLTY